MYLTEICAKRKQTNMCMKNIGGPKIHCKFCLVLSLLQKSLWYKAKSTLTKATFKVWTSHLMTTSTQHNIQWTRHFRVIDSSGSPSHKHFCFFQNIKVCRFINYPVIFPNLLAALNFLLFVKFWYTEVVITKRLTAPLLWKVKIPAKSLHPTS